MRRTSTRPKQPAHQSSHSPCIACHQLESEHFTHTLHALGLHAAHKADASIPVCETCHGPGSAHAQAPLAKGLILAYTKNGGTTIELHVAAPDGVTGALVVDLGLVEV